MGALVRQTFFHQPADLELDGTLAGDADFFHGLGVLGDAGGSLADLEHAEVAEFQPVALSQFADDFFEEPLDDLLDDHALVAGVLCDSIHQVFFGDGYWVPVGAHRDPQIAAAWRRIIAHATPPRCYIQSDATVKPTVS